MNIEFTVFIKDNKIIYIVQNNDDIFYFIENVLDLNPKNMTDEEMFQKIIDYVDYVQNIELEVEL